LRSTTLDSLHTGVSPGSIGWQYTYSGPLSSADLCTTTLGISPSNPVPVPVTCRTSSKRDFIVFIVMGLHTVSSYSIYLLMGVYGTREKESNQFCGVKVARTDFDLALGWGLDVIVNPGQGGGFKPNTILVGI
jgi:hypothetical protein